LIKPDSAGLSGDLRDNMVAFANFTYANTSIISKLQKRGSKIAGRKFAKLPKLEGEIFAKDVNFPFRSAPLSVYITFEDSLSVERALASNSRDKDAARVEILKSQCFGDKPFLPVTEPSEVIWENKHLGTCNRVIRVVLTYFCALGVMS
jgi:hypothetical protein